MNCVEHLKLSPWSYYPNEDGNGVLRFHINGKPIVEITMDESNRILLAQTLIKPYKYNPSHEEVLVRLCQNE